MVAPWRTCSSRDLLHQARADGVDAFERLVHQKQLWPMDERCRHGRALAHTFRIFGDQLTGLRVELEQGEQFAGPGFGEGPLEAVHASHKLDVLGAGEVVEEQSFVGDQADLLLDIDRALGHRQTEQFDRAGGGRRGAMSMRMVVVFPAPLGPRKPKKLPRGTWKLRPSTAALSP
jgi:hypothetical protein